MPQSSVEQPMLGNGPQLLAMRVPAFILTLLAPTLECKVNDIQKRLKVTQLGFQETMMKWF